ncbi:MAG TPA: septal ring lytic transglycosylase RlpA family protein [Polyangiaceae bacterium]|nr:septal ring lytic transglycosylase RlpA family protein [Polyangiaceae bacterium]
MGVLLGSRRGAALWLAGTTMLLAVGCAHGHEAPPPREPAYETAASSTELQPRSEVQMGYATWYGDALAGHRTADGGRFDPTKMTAAHRTLPFGTWVDVTRLDTGLTVRVKITDRGPFGHPDRIIDLSREAARKIGSIKTGVFRVKVTIVPEPGT